MKIDHIALYVNDLEGAKAFFETCTDADLDRYSTNIGLILKWAMETQDVVDSIRADRMPDEQCFTLHL